MMSKTEQIVAIFGGAVAGSEAAFQLAERGIHSVVFDMEALPYGKIELGLPKWHAKQRDQEEAAINEKLESPFVTYVPKTKLGRDLSIEEVAGWGFSAILLAVGAWRDRPLAVPGIDGYQGKGFYYQNPFVSWFNQYHSPDYSGPDIEIADNSAVIGGGLASIDVAKILMIEMTLRALKDRGMESDLFIMEKKGIPRALESLNLKWEDLGLKGCTLYYRRRDIDMPLMPLAEKPTPGQLEQAKVVRQKLLATAQAKYLFNFQPCCLPTASVIENDRLVGLEFKRTTVENGKAHVLDNERFEIRTPLVISSIGSLPEPLPGISLDWDLFPIESETTGKVRGFKNVFALGNAVTGRGNIRASRIHAKEVSNWICNEFLNTTMTENVKNEEILARVQILQRKVGYDGDYKSWISHHQPVRLETMND